jgi:hypothetical protein
LVEPVAVLPEQTLTEERADQVVVPVVTVQVVQDLQGVVLHHQAKDLQVAMVRLAQQTIVVPVAVAAQGLQAPRHQVHQVVMVAMV